MDPWTPGPTDDAHRMRPSIPRMLEILAKCGGCCCSDVANLINRTIPNLTRKVWSIKNCGVLFYWFYHMMFVFFYDMGILVI